MPNKQTNKGSRETFLPATKIKELYSLVHYKVIRCYLHDPSFEGTNKKDSV